MNLDALVAPLRADVVSGASVVARTAARVVSRAALRVPADTVDGLREVLVRLTLRILDAQPAMAPLVTLGCDVLNAVEGASDVEEARRAAAGAADTFGGDIDRRTAAVGAAGAGRIPARATILTLSSSSSVRSAILGVPDPRSIRAVCLESRPMSEGQMLAAALAGAGVPVTFAVDAAVEALVPRADIVLLGADSVGDRGVVNKLGSAAVVSAAARAGVPVLVLADRTKLLPRGFPQPTADDRPADEIWRAPAGVHVWNRYFEAFPLGGAEAVVTEDGTRRPDEIDRMRAGLTLPGELEAWARTRSPAG